MIAETLEIIFKRFPEEFQDDDCDMPNSFLMLACFTGALIFVIYVLIGCYGNLHPMHFEVNPNHEDLMEDLDGDIYQNLSNYFHDGDEEARDEGDEY